MSREYDYQYEEDLDNYARRSNISLGLLVVSAVIGGIMLFGAKSYDSQELSKKARVPAATAAVCLASTALYARRYNNLISGLNRGVA